MKKCFMKIKRWCALILCISMLSTSVLAVEANDERLVEVDGKQVYVQMADGSPCTWSNAEIYTLLDGAELEDGMLITIWDCKEAEKADNGGIAPLWYESYENELIDYSEEKTVVSDMLFSVARGQTLTLTKKYEASFEFKLIGESPFNLSSIKAEGTVKTSYAYEISESYTGPSDSTNNNTRAFYVKHYYREETWEQTEYDFALRPQRTMQTTVERPLRSVSFSIDSYETLN